MTNQDPTAFFWDIATPLLFQDGIEKSTMFGNPCIRINTQFSCMADHRTGGMIIKLPAKRVQAIIAAGHGNPVAPSGRTFKEWVEITTRDSAQWEALIQDSLRFVDK